MMNNVQDGTLLEHLVDLQERSQRYHKTLASYFLNEDEQAIAKTKFPQSEICFYDGGYPEARKKRLIFQYDDDEFHDIVCIVANIDQRFRKLSHKDILGALMNLQIDRHQVGDFWIEEDHIYIYTSMQMGKFLIDHLTRINQLNVEFSFTEKRPIQVFQTKEIICVLSSLRIDTIVSALAKCSRSQAVKMIEQGFVAINHITIENQALLCHNNVTISIRKVGRFVFLGEQRKTQKDKIVAKFMQYIS